MAATVMVKLDVVGFHAWPQAPDHVAYLRDKHRHVFGIKIGATVDNPDRQIEYHSLKRDATALIANFFGRDGFGEFDFEDRSCEAIADSVGALLRSYRIPVSFVEVWEDDENGSRLDFPPLPPPEAASPVQSAIVEGLKKVAKKAKDKKRGRK